MNSTDAVQIQTSIENSETEIKEAYNVVVEALSDCRVILSKNKKEWTEILRLADKIPYRYNGAYRNFRSELIAEKTKVIRQDRIESAPSSNLKHVGVKGLLSLALVRRVEDVIQRRWVTVPRVEAPKGRKDIQFEAGVPVGAKGRCDHYGYWVGMPPMNWTEPSTSIVCNTTDASLLQLFDLTMFVENIRPEMEAYYRSVADFSWEEDPV